MLTSNKTFSAFFWSSMLLRPNKPHINKFNTNHRLRKLHCRSLATMGKEFTVQNWS